MKKLGGIDASFLYMETPETPMHVAGLTLIELPAGYSGNFYEDYKAHIARRLHLAPLLAKKLVAVPFDIDHPLLVDDEDIDLDYHIRHLVLSPPGTTAQLEELVGRLHSNFLDRSRPLWEFYVIDGLQNAQVAIYTKIHHALVDGGAGMALNTMMYDLTAAPREVEAPPPKLRAASKQLDPGMLLGTAYSNFLTQQIKMIQAIPDVWKTIANFSLPSAESPKLPQPGGQPVPIAPRTSLNGAITSQRIYTARSVSLAEAKRIAKASATTLNDVVMAVCGGALRRYLAEKNDLPDKPLVAFVPVSLRQPGNTDMSNQVFGMLCSIATDVAAPLERLKAINAASSSAKQLTGKIKDLAPRDFALFGAPFFLQGLIGLYGRSKIADSLPPAANVTISNVPGPQAPLYLAGAKLLTLYPVSIPAHGVALNITVQSYCGALDFGFTACRRTVPDVRKLADFHVDALHELSEALPAEARAAKASQAELRP
jgi:diacylglycerol O-acyltransferase / wax synthase